MQGTARDWGAGCCAARGEGLRLACMSSSDETQHVSRPGALRTTTQHPGVGERAQAKHPRHTPHPPHTCSTPPVRISCCTRSMLLAMPSSSRRECGAWASTNRPSTSSSPLEPAQGGCTQAAVATGQEHASSGCYWASTRKLRLQPVGNSGRTAWGSPHKQVMMAHRLFARKFCASHPPQSHTQPASSEYSSSMIPTGQQRIQLVQNDNHPAPLPRPRCLRCCAPAAAGRLALLSPACALPAAAAAAGRRLGGLASGAGQRRQRQALQLLQGV